MEYKGIDVSKYQGNVDYKKVRENGIDFVIIRIGYGMYENQIDPLFEKNYNNALKNNLPVGVYIYSYALNVSEAEREALVVLKWLNGRKLNLPVYYDIEDKSQTNLGKSNLTNMCKAFCRKIESAGYWAGIYANKYWLSTLLDASELSKFYTIWVAQYNDRVTYDGKFDMWQYTSSGVVSGVNGKVDMNILYRNIFSNSNGTNSDRGENDIDLSGYNGSSIVDALKYAGYDSSFSFRSDLYKRYGFKDEYVGSAAQNTNLLAKLQGKKTAYYPKVNYKGFSLVDALKKINVDSSFDNRKNIALKNGLSDYKGTLRQNIKLLNLLKNGMLKK